MADTRFERLWALKLEPWLKSKEQERVAITIRFYLIGLPGVALGALAGWGLLALGVSLEFSILAGLLLASILAGIGYRPVQQLEADYLPRMRQSVLEAFSLQELERLPADFLSDSFRRQDLLFHDDGRLDEGCHGEVAGRRFEAVKACFEWLGTQEARDQYPTYITSFSGVLVRIKLKNSPASEVIATREEGWFSCLSQAGVSFAAGRLDLNKLDNGFFAYAGSREQAEAVITPVLAETLKSLEPVFAERPLRLAIVPEAEGGVCYIAAETKGLTESFSLLVPSTVRGSFHAMIEECRGIVELAELIVTEVDGGSVDAH